MVEIKQHAVMARENNEGGVVWLSFPSARVRMEPVVSLKMTDCSRMSEEKHHNGRMRQL